MESETTITVRGIDSNVWKEFQDSIRRRYGDLFGKLGPEVTSALRAWLAASREEPAKTDYAKYALKPDIPRVLDSSGGLSVKQLILEAMRETGGEAYIQEVISYIHEKYGRVNPNTISTAMSDLAVNGPPSSLYPMETRFLERVARGKYRLIRRGEG